jgi:cob(I)alamin adenosyltransferase
VGVVQFIKGAWHSGERTALGLRDQISGTAWARASPGRRRTARATSPPRAGLGAGAKQLMADPTLRLWCWTSSTSRCATTTGPGRGGRDAGARGRDLHIVVTGRNAKPELIAAADCVTEMGATKHHFSRRRAAQKGVEF